MSKIASILLHVDDSPRTALRVRLARQLAEAFDARVVARHAATPAMLRYPMAMESTAAVAAYVAQADEEDRLAAKAVFEAERHGDARLGWMEKGCDPASFAVASLYHDLLIVGQLDPNEPSSFKLPDDFVQSLVIDSGKPTLVVPREGAFSPSPDTVMVAWKPTAQAARAVTAALPWLQRAREVVIACYGEGSGHASEQLRAYLALHGIANVRRDVVIDEAAPAGDLLLARAAETRSELLVMGCYGHSRAREWVLGGASRTVLRSMTLPVLLTH